MITSSTNLNYKRWHSLSDSQGILKQKQFLVSGQKVIEEILAQYPEKVIEVLASEEFGPKLSLKHQTHLIEKKLFKELDQFNTKSSLLVCRANRIEKWNPDAAPKGLELLCPFGDPRNLGAMMRSALAFGVSKLVLLTEAANPYLPLAVRSSSGAVLKLKLEQGPSIKALSNVKGLVALDFGGTPIDKFPWKQNIRLLVGEEGPGLWDMEFSTKISIAMTKTVESLNAAVAASIALHAYRSVMLRQPLI
ncbi:MAG: TrmH family RNA methyltransferase [Pseudomonadota bacterium]|nr:TrmH family RNA methyltransferase [Pseudomonadota bacterium]